MNLLSLAVQKASELPLIRPSGALSPLVLENSSDCD